MRVQDIMVNDIATCAPDANLESVAMMMWDNDCGIVPITDKHGKPLGIITDRDISIAAAMKHRQLSEISVSDVKDGQIVSCQPDQDVKNALKMMRDTKIRRLPVVDRQGSLVGMLSMGDIVANVTTNSNTTTPDNPTCEDIVSTLKAVYIHH